MSPLRFVRLGVVAVRCLRLLCGARSWLGEEDRRWRDSGSSGSGVARHIQHVALHELLMRGVELAKALEVMQRDVAHVRVALDVVPVDAHEAVHVLEDHAHAQAAELDLGVARLAARVRAARRLDDVRVVLGPRRERAIGARGRRAEIHVRGGE